MKGNNDLNMRATYNLMRYINYFLISNLLFFISILAPVAWLIFFTPSLMNVIAIGFIFPGIAALVSNGIKYKESKPDAILDILKHFTSGYRKNFKDTMKYCFIYAAIIFTVLFNIAYYDGEIPMFMLIALFVLITLSTLMVTYMMVIATKFQFRTRDLLRVSAYCLLMHFKVTIKLFITYVIFLVAYPWVGVMIMLVFASPIIYLITRFVHPVLDDVYETFVEKSE